VARFKTGFCHKLSRGITSVSIRVEKEAVHLHPEFWTLLIVHRQSHRKMWMFWTF